MIPSLRDYQLAGVEAIRDAYRKGARAVLYQLATGGGKTPIFCFVAQNAVQRGNRVCVLVHRRELLKQASKHLVQWGVPHGVISPDHRFTGHPVQVASVQTLVRRTDRYTFDLLVFDECHHAVAATWTRITQAYPAARVLGVTATPCRLAGAGLGTVFDRLVCGPPVEDLMARGFLSPYRYFRAPVDIDLRGLRSQGGDYQAGALEDLMNRREITGSAVEQYRKHAPGMPAMVFCSSAAHADAVAAEFRAAGYRAISVDGSMPTEQRDAAFGGLASGRYTHLMACDLASEGVDIPGVSCAIMLRPTKSPIICRQQWGRALRTAPGKTHAIILDHVGNWLRHGLPDSPVQWSLEQGCIRPPEDSVPRVRQCPRCFFVHPFGPECPECSYIYPLPGRKPPKEVDGQLSEITDSERAAFWDRARTTGSLAAYHDWAKATGRPPGAAWMAFKKNRRGRRTVAVGER